MDLIVLTGPIAAGKSAVARGVARRACAALIDLDRVYELLAPDPKADETVWARERRLAGAMASNLFEEGRRAQADPTRGLSRDPAFLRVQLGAFARALPWLREASEVLDTDALDEAELVERVGRGLSPRAGWSARSRCQYSL